MRLAEGKMVADVMDLREEDLQSWLDLLQKVNLFEGATTGQLLEIIQVGQACHFSPGTVIIAEGQVGTTFYLLKSGTVWVWQQDQTTGKPLQELVSERGRGDYIGEIALLTGGRRNATCMAQTVVEALAIEQPDFERLVHPFFESAYQRQQATQIRRRLENMPVFMEVPMLTLHQLAALAQPVAYPPGTAIINSDELGQYFYIIETGLVALLTKDPATGKYGVTGQRSGGEFFGNVGRYADIEPGTLAVSGSRVELLAIAQNEAYQEIFENSVTRRFFARMAREYRGRKRTI
jgi:CRP-like cAMP-binding protein